MSFALTREQFNYGMKDLETHYNHIQKRYARVCVCVSPHVYSGVHVGQGAVSDVILVEPIPLVFETGSLISLELSKCMR